MYSSLCILVSVYAHIMNNVIDLCSIYQIDESGDTSDEEDDDDREDNAPQGTYLPCSSLLIAS